MLGTMYFFGNGVAVDKKQGEELWKKAAAQGDTVAQKRLADNTGGTAQQQAKSIAAPAGFIALSDIAITWDEAKAFCQQQGGRLPRINGSGSLRTVTMNKGATSIEGFGTIGFHWPARMPRVFFWSGTVASATPGRSWAISCTSSDGTINLSGSNQSAKYRAACVR